MTNRFIFRQVYYKDLQTFLMDGEIRAKNHPNMQRLHQTSYQAIVDRRGTDEFPMPNGMVVNDFVAFYFSPITSFTYAIYNKRVPLLSPQGENLGQACEDDRIFMVSTPQKIYDCGLTACFSDYALNSQAPIPTIETDLNRLEDHIHWDVFDEQPMIASIPKIGYHGVCKWFKNRATPEKHKTRNKKRMAEFLVCNAVPLDTILCIVVKTDDIKAQLQDMMDASEWNIPILTKPGCFYG